MIVCSEIRSQEREGVVVDRVRILVEELLKEGGTGIGVAVCQSGGRRKVLLGGWWSARLGAVVTWENRSNR